MEETISLFLAGLLGGFLAGYTGVGGGIVYIMVLPYVFTKQGVEEHSLAAIIVANSIFGIFLASLLSVVTHARLKTLYVKESLLVSLPAVLVALVLLKFIVTSPIYSYFYFNLFIVALMSIVLLIYFLQRNGRKELTVNEKEKSIVYIVSGSISGIVSSLGGVGGAITLIPLMQHWQRISIKKAKSISLAMILLMTGSMSLYNFFYAKGPDGTFGLLEIQVIAPMLAGIFVTSWLGVKLAHRSNPKYIERIFLLFTMIVMINKLYLLLSQ